MSPALRQIRTLDPVKDHQKILFLSMRQDFPFDSTRALELALFRTYCAPRISGPLSLSGEFEHRAQKRYDDTDLLVSEIVENGYDSPRGREAIDRINAIHGRFRIDNREMRYVLSTFVFEPIRWNARYGWRRLSDAERIAYFHFWREVGARMNIRDLPTDIDAFERLSLAYEADETLFRKAPSNKRIGDATREMMVRWFPPGFGFLVRRGLYAALDPQLIDLFEFPRPLPIERAAQRLAMRLRALLLRILPKRRRPVLRTRMRHRSYPEGYEIRNLGPAGPPLPARPTGTEIPVIPPDTRASPES